MDLVDTVLLTHEHFISAEDLLEQLIERFNVQLSPDASAEDRQYFEANRRGIQLKVLTVISNWTKNHWADFDANEELFEMLESFLDELRQMGCASERGGGACAAGG